MNKKNSKVRKRKINALKSQSSIPDHLMANSFRGVGRFSILFKHLSIPEIRQSQTIIIKKFDQKRSEKICSI